VQRHDVIAKVHLSFDQVREVTQRGCLETINGRCFENVVGKP
jgi:hypothetical protein